MFLGYQARRDCTGRLDALRPVLSQFKRRFSVIDLGAGEGYFTDAIALSYDAMTVAVEGADLYSGPNPCIKRCLSSYDINELAKGEHFDVVLCLSMLHHVPDWRGFLQGVFALGEHIFIEYPNVKDERTIQRPGVEEQCFFLSALDHERVAFFRSFHGYEGARSLIYIHNPKTEVENTAFYYERNIKRTVTRRIHPVFSSFRDKRILKFGSWLPWQHGVNLNSYIHLGGVGRDRIRLEQPKVRHGDLKAWNYVLDGFTATPIDYDRKRTHPDVEGYRTVSEWLKNGGRLC